MRRAVSFSSAKYLILIPHPRRLPLKISPNTHFYHSLDVRDGHFSIYLCIASPLSSGRGNKIVVVVIIIIIVFSPTVVMLLYFFLGFFAHHAVFNERSVFVFCV